MVYTRYITELPHIQLRLEFMKLRNHTIPGLDEAAMAMFKAYDLVLATYRNPIAETFHRRVDTDLYCLEKACWELICTSIQNFKDPVVEITNGFRSCWSHRLHRICWERPKFSRHQANKQIPKVRRQFRHICCGKSRE